MPASSLARALLAASVSAVLLGCGPRLASDGIGRAMTPDTPIAPTAINDTLFDRMVATEANRMRARHGVAPLDTDPGLARAAAVHARNMARFRTLSHDLPARGQESLGERLRTASVSYRRAGENILSEKVYRIIGAPVSAQFDGCSFTYAGSGAPVPMHSYASLAEAAMAQWMASPLHRDNLLSPHFRRIGTAFAIDPAGSACGDVYLAQVFAD